MIDRAMILEHLAQAEHHVELGEGHVKRQREIVAELAADNHATKAARDLLQQFEQLQALHVADRDRLRNELAGSLKEKY